MVYVLRKLERVNSLLIVDRQEWARQTDINKTSNSAVSGHIWSKGAAASYYYIFTNLIE